jgi:hypothetical protein
MQRDAMDAVRQVLNEAGDTPHFFDLSDCERLNWMIARGFELGKRAAEVCHDRRRSIKKNRHLGQPRVRAH